MTECIVPNALSSHNSNLDTILVSVLKWALVLTSSAIQLTARLH